MLHDLPQLLHDAAVAHALMMAIEEIEGKPVKRPGIGKRLTQHACHNIRERAAEILDDMARQGTLP